MASTTRKRATSLTTTTVSRGAGATTEAVENFGIFIDTHRDQPHVPTFEDDLHRGMAHPTPVHYVPPAAAGPADHMGWIVRADDGRMIEVHDKHRFIEMDWWVNFVTNYMIDHGASPVASSGEYKGQLSTSHLRDARKGVYVLRSLRQMVRAREKASTTVAAVPKRGWTVTVGPTGSTPIMAIPGNQLAKYLTQKKGKTP